MDLKGQVAIVTGSSQGIGQAVALHLAKAGASVLVNYIGNDEPARKTVAMIESYGSKGAAFHADISEKKNIENMFKYCTEKLGRPDILVANAGVCLPPKPMAEITEEDYEKTFNVNVKGNIFLIIEAAKQLNNGGRIVVVTSSQVINPQLGCGVYVSSKSAIQAFAEYAALEVADRGISVNTVRPGLTLTPLSEGDLSPDFLNFVKEGTPFKRLGRPDDIAGVICLFCEKRSQWVSGQHITANGGSKF